MYRILAVDDEENNLQAIQRIFFDSNDYELKYSDNGSDAIQLAEDFVPDVILLDIMMPNMNGYEVCQRIKSNPRTADIMVLFLSGKSMLSDRLKGYEALADDYIAKPFENEELLAKLRILVRLKKTQDKLREINHNLEEIVEQRTRQLVIKERQAIVGRMVHGIVHNFRNPLMVASGFANIVENKIAFLLPYSINWLPEQQQSIEKAKDGVKTVIHSLGKIEELVNSLLIKGRKEGTYKYQKINLNELIVSEVKFLESDPTIKHQVIKEFHLDPCLPDFLGNYADFSQVVGNMIQNAVDAMHNTATRKITITTNHDFENIYIYFKDTGHGISPQLIDKIFEPFFSTKAFVGQEKGDEPTGSGLGLYSCQQLIKKYNGTITVRSESNVGITFAVTIPYTENQNVDGDMN